MKDSLTKVTEKWNNYGRTVEERNRDGGTVEQ